MLDEVMPDPRRRRGLMLVMSSPSGAGKTSISRRVLELEPELALSISVTTRPQRPGEIDGTHYRFIPADRFAVMAAAGELLEHATVYGHSYGTPRAAVEQALADGRDVLFDIDWQGTQQLKEKAGSDLVTVFILPPSTRDLERRLITRAQDSMEVVQKRMAKAADEMSHWAEYDYQIINRDIATSLMELKSILTAERLKRERQVGLSNFVKALREGR